MNILFLTRRFYPDIGGVEKHVLRLSEELIKNGHSVSVVTKTSGENKSIKGIKIFRINNGSKKYNKFKIWFWIWKNRKLIKEADVVHAHDVYFWYFPFRLIFPFKKSFVTFHGYESYPIKKRAIFIRKITEILSNGNIIVGDFIRKWYHTNPNYVIYGAVDIPKALKPVKYSQSAIFIGRLDEQTGILDYVKAVDIIKNKFPNFKFDIFGDGEYKSKLGKFNPKGFTKNAENLIPNYKFAFVSRYLSILEALANRRLVFALYDNPVKEDYLKMSPFSKYILIVHSPEEIKKSIYHILKNPKEEKRLTDDGYLWVKDFTWKKMMEIYANLWEK